jgi:hypothetical protein
VLATALTPAQRTWREYVGHKNDGFGVNCKQDIATLVENLKVALKNVQDDAGWRDVGT